MSKNNDWAGIIKSRVSIQEHVRRYENSLVDRGRYLQGEHSNKHSSKGGQCLTVYEDGFHCFHCGVGGDIISYEQDRLGTDDFVVVCESLADTYNIELPKNGTPLSEKEKEVRQNAKERRNTVAGLLNSAADFYHNNLGENKKYFIERGFSDFTIEKHKLGYADAKKTSLYSHLSEFCKDDDILLSTGLFYKTDNGKLLDSLNNRYVFPYFINKIGDVSYFIGRDATPNQSQKAKYHKIRVNGSDSAVEHVLWNAHNVKDSKKPIIVCEGIVDALLVEQELGNEYYVISPVTVRLNAPDIEKIGDLLSQEKHQIIFLNDNEENQAGIKGALDTVDKVGKSTLEKLIKKHDGDKSKAISDFPEIRVATLRKPPYVDKIDAADYIQQRKIQELRYWIEASRSVKQVREYLDDNPQRFFDGKDGREFRLKYIADEILYEGRYFITIGGLLAEYKYKNGGGYYDSKHCESNIAKIAKRKLGKYHGIQRINEVVSSLKIDRVYDEMDLDRENINLDNGVFDMKSMSVRQSITDDVYIHQIPVSYDENAECPNFEKFVSEVVPGDEQIIFEMIGYSLQSHCANEKVFMLIGSGENGKSILLETIEDVIGRKNIAATSPQDLLERFGPINLFGKIACINNDIPNKAFASSEMLKQIASGNTINVQAKFGQPFDFRPYATLIYAGNEMPKSYDHTHGYYRRFIIIKFEQQFLEGDPRRRDPRELKAELIAEKQGIISKALKAYKQVETKGVFTESDNIKAAKTEYKVDNEPALQFVEEMLISDANGFIPSAEMTSKYKKWCESNNSRPVKAKVLIEVFEEVFDEYKYTPMKIDGKQVKGHRGIRFLKMNEVVDTKKPIDDTPPSPEMDRPQDVARYESGEISDISL